MKRSYIYFISILLFIGCEVDEDNEFPSEWFEQREKQDDITYYSIVFSDKNNGWILGYSGTIKYSPDGGDTWKSQKSGVLSNLWDACFINSEKGWACGDSSTVLRTIDGGISWQNISPIHSKRKVYVSIKFVDEKIGWTSNNNGEILKSIDSGLSWELKKKFESGGSRLAVFDANTVYALKGYLYRTYNSGLTWDSLSISIPKNYAASDMFFSNMENGWITTQNGTGGAIITEYPVIITNDGGMTWFSSDSLEDWSLSCCYFIDENIGWVAGVQNVYKTTDGGKHWKYEFSPDNGELLRAKDIFFISENSGWIINWEGNIYKYESTSH